MFRFLRQITAPRVEEQIIAYKIVWIIISLISLFILLFAFFVPEEVIIKTSPKCISIINNNAKCSLCGMTRAFIEISKGSIAKALALNSGSMILYFLMTINVVLCSVYFIFRYFKARQFTN
jgi:hypothetical protein